MITAPQGGHIKGDDLGSAFGICATEKYRVCVETWRNEMNWVI